MHANRRSWYPRFVACLVGLLTGIVVALPSLRVMAQSAQASPSYLSTGNPPGSDGATLGRTQLTVQDPKWVALKAAFKVQSGVSRGQAKGTITHTYIGDAPAAGCTQVCELSLYSGEVNSFEPGSGVQFGSRSNFTGTGYDNNVQDDKCGYNGCYTDGLFFDLCGPGAADNALWSWPWPPNLHNYTNGINEYVNNVTTYWNGTDIDKIPRARGYMLHLAYEIQVPGWPRAGMNMQQSDWNTYPNHRGKGATQGVMNDALNWEASGEGSLGNWTTYFYLAYYATDHQQPDFHSEVVQDIKVANEPVVVMVNTNGLPNWGYGGNTVHFITIVGFDDANGNYQYLDTCASITGCGSNTNGGVQTVNQTTLYKNTYSWSW